MAGVQRFCTTCGSALGADGRCPNGHGAGAAPLAPRADAPLAGTPAIGETLRLAWQLLARQPALLWLPIEAAAVATAWVLGFLATLAASAAIAHARATTLPVPYGFTVNPGGGLALPVPVRLPVVGRLVPPLIGRLFTSLAAARGAFAVTLLWMLAGLLFLVPYAAGGAMGGLIRALDGRVRASAFWSDGLRYFGRSYLALIAVAITALVPVLAALLWSGVWFRVGHVVGPVLGILGDVVLAVGTVPFLWFVGAAVYQSGWQGFGQAVSVVRGRWLTALALLVVLSLIGALVSWIGTLLYAIPVLGWLVGTVLSGAAAIFSSAGVLLYYRGGAGLGVGDWAAAAAGPPSPGGHAYSAGGAGAVLAAGPPPEAAWTEVRRLLPRWGGLLRPSVQEAIPALIGSPRHGLAALAELMRPAEALALPADAFALFGAVLAGPYRPWWGWPVGALVGFIFGVVWIRLVAAAAHAASRGQEGISALDGDGAVRLVSLAFLLPAVLAVVDLIFFLLTHRFSESLPLAALVSTFPFAVGGIQASGGAGWRSVIFGAAITLATLIPWLVIQGLLLRIR